MFTFNVSGNVNLPVTPHESGLCPKWRRQHHVDIKNGFKAETAGRGSVNKLDFAVVNTRCVLLRARDVQGQILNKGAGVFNAEQQFLTTVVDSGKIFLSNDQ